VLWWVFMIMIRNWGFTMLGFCLSWSLCIVFLSLLREMRAACFGVVLSEVALDRKGVFRPSSQSGLLPAL
jgi:hypothetical protein